MNSNLKIRVWPKSLSVIIAVPIVVSMTVAILLPLQNLQAAEIRVVGTYFSIHGLLNPFPKNGHAVEVFNCLLAPLEQEIVFQGHSRERINILRDRGQADIIFPSGKFSSWTNHETLWIGPTHHIELSWVRLSDDARSTQEPTAIPKDVIIGVERNSYAEKWLRLNGYANLILVDLIDRLYAGLITKQFAFVLTLSREFSSYDSGLLQRAEVIEIPATKIPVGMTLTKSFIDSHPEFIAQLDDQLSQCWTLDGVLPDK